MATIFETDYAWADVKIEREALEKAGHHLVCGPASPASAKEIAALVREIDPAAILTCWAELDASTIALPSNLRIIQRIGAGVDNIDVAAATRRGTWVANVPDYCVPEVSDHAVGLLLSWARGIPAFDRQVKNGRWCPADARLRRVSELTIGVVGFGRIGRRTAEKLQAFGCKVIAASRSIIASGIVKQVSLDALLGSSDVVILTLPYLPETHHLIDAARLNAMKRGAVLINVSRGGIVDTQALLNKLEEGHLAGAALDVVEGEPHPPVSLIAREDVIVTPHVAFSSEASLRELRNRAAEEVVRVLAGERPRNPCNTPESK